MRLIAALSVAELCVLTALVLLCHGCKVEFVTQEAAKAAGGDSGLAADAGGPSDGGDGTRDAGREHDVGSIPDVGPNGPWPIAWTVRLNGGEPDAHEVEVFALDQVVGSPDLRIRNSAYAGTAGRYDMLLVGCPCYLYAYYSDTLSAAGTEFLAAYAHNPIPASAVLDGLDIDLATVNVAVSSLNLKKGSVRQGDMAITWPLLTHLEAKVEKPGAGAFDGATVTAGDRRSTFRMIWDPAAASYIYEIGKTASEPTTARQATYTFTVSAPIFGGRPVVLAIDHRPLMERPTITAPVNDSGYGTVQPITVDWEGVQGTNVEAIAVYDAESRALVFTANREEVGEIARPYTIPWGTFAKGRSYEIHLYVYREVTAPSGAGQSIERSGDWVKISF